MNASRAICTLESMAIDMVGTLGGLSATNQIATVLERQIEAINMAQDALRAVRDLATNENASHISIDRMNEILQAEREGRLFTLHCKIGDTVYIPDVEKGIVAPVRVQGISITVSGRVLLHFGGYPAECAWDYDCGKGWYKTSEAAEKALEEANG